MASSVFWKHPVYIYKKFYAKFWKLRNTYDPYYHFKIVIEKNMNTIKIRFWKKVNNFINKKKMDKKSSNWSSFTLNFEKWFFLAEEFKPNPKWWSQTVAHLFGMKFPKAKCWLHGFGRNLIWGFQKRMFFLVPPLYIVGLRPFY